MTVSPDEEVAWGPGRFSRRWQHELPDLVAHVRSKAAPLLIDVLNLHERYKGAATDPSPAIYRIRTRRAADRRHADRIPSRFSMPRSTISVDGSVSESGVPDAGLELD